MRRETQRDCVDEIRKNSSLSRRRIGLRACSFGGNAFSHIVHRLSSLYAIEGRGLWELHCGFCASCDMGVPLRLQTSVKRPCKGHLTCATRRTRLRHSPPPSRVPRALTTANPWSPSNTPVKLSRRRCLQSPRRCNQLRTTAEHLCPLLHLLQLLPMTTRVSALCYER